MVMFLMAACVAMFGLAITAMAFGAATRDSRRPSDAVLEPRLALPKSDFFIDDAAPRPSPQPLAVDALLLQIEGHVRLEQAAAESFVDAPTSQSLHSRTASPLMN